MRVEIMIKGKWVAATGIPCGQGDTVEVRDGIAKGFHTGRGRKWRRLDRRESTHKVKK